MKVSMRAYIYRIILILLLVSVPPFLIGSVYNMNLLYHQMTGLIISKNANELTRTGFLMEESLKKIMDTVLSVVTNAEYNKTETVVDQIDTTGKLTKLAFDNKYFDSVLLYNARDDYLLVSNYGIVRNPDETAYRWTKEQLSKSNNNSNYQITVTDVHQVERGADKRYIVSLLAKHPILQSDNYLIFNINVESLYQDFLWQLNVDQGTYHYYLTDSAGKIVFNKQNSQVDVANPKKNDEPLVNNYFLDSMKWNLVSEVNMQILFKEVDELSNRMLILLFVSIAIIMVLIIFGSRLLYKPVYRVISKLAVIVNKSKGKQGEFEFIHSAVDDMIRTNDQLQRKLHENGQLLKRTLLYHHIKQRVRHQFNADHNLSDLDYEAPHAVAVFTLDRQAICIEDDCDYEFSRRLEIGLQKRFSIDLFVESDKECIVLFRADCADANVFAAELTDCLDPGLLRALTVSIGGFYSLAFINHSYTEALYAFNMGRIYSVQMNIYCYNRLPKDIESKPIRNPTIEELELAVRKRNEEGYTRLLNTMFKEDISVMEYNHNLYMAATLLIRLYDKDSVTFLDEINGLITDKGIMNTAVVKHFFYTKFKAFEADYRTDFNQYMNKINRFVGECYTTDFSLDELAASVGLTKPYLCNWFQQHYGTTIVDYVNRYRTNQAKELLSGSSAKISVVGRMVGFNSNSYFTKIFREYNGITPTEYRELSWNKNESPNNPVAILVDG